MIRVWLSRAARSVWRGAHDGVPSLYGEPARQQSVLQRARGNLSPLMPSAENLAVLENARARMQAVTVLEERSTLATTDMGTGVEYAANGLRGAPQSVAGSRYPADERPDRLQRHGSAVHVARRCHPGR